MINFTRKIVLTLSVLSLIGLCFARESVNDIGRSSLHENIIGVEEIQPFYSPLLLPAESSTIRLDINPVGPVCEGSSIVLSPTGSSDKAYAYEWYEVLEDGTEKRISEKKNRRVHNLKRTTTFILKAYYFNGELITNGDFGANQSDINWAAHGSDYDRINTAPKHRTLWSEGTYHIGPNPKNQHNHFSSVGDHTTGKGNMFMVNGSTHAGDRVWFHNGISVKANTTYAFSAWGKNLTMGNPANLDFSINGDPLGPLNLGEREHLSMNKWNEFYVLWNSGNARRANISLVNTLTQGDGNDFALDDISFSPMIEVVRSIKVKVTPRVEIDRIDVSRICLNEKVVLEAVVNKGGDGDATMSWRKDGKAINARNIIVKGNQLTIEPFLPENEGVYQFSIRNNCFQDNVQKDVYLKPAPVIEKQPVSKTACVGAPVVFSIKLNDGSRNLQWYHNGVPIPKATSSEYRFNAVIGDAGTYKCKITDDCHELESNTVNLVVNENTKLTKDLILHPICSDKDVQMEVDATGSGTLHYQWFRGTTPIAGANKKQYSFTSRMEDDGDNFYCIVSSSTRCGTAQSSIRTLHVDQNTVIDKSPMDYSACVGGNHTFKVDAKAKDIVYQWQHNDKDIPGANSAALVLNDIQLAKAGNYKCVVSGTCGSENSTAAQLTVHEKTRITNILPVLSPCEGGKVDFAITTRGTIKKYTWLHQGKDKGVNQPNISLEGLKVSDAGKIKVVVDGVCESDWKETTLNVIPTTKITDGPHDSPNTCLGGTASFLVKADGEDLNYSWSFNGVNVGNQASLNLSEVTKAQAGEYTVTVKGTCDSDTESAQLTVNDLTKITAGFNGLSACENDDVTLSVTAEGDNNTYKWYKDKILISTKAGFTLNNVTTVNAGLYKCEVVGVCGSDDLTGRLDVDKNTRITKPLDDEWRCVGNGVTFTVETEGANRSYTWTKGGVDQGNNSSIFTIPSLKEGDIGSHKVECLVKGTCGADQVSSADLTVYPTTVITDGLDDIDVCVGGKLTYSVKVKAKDPVFEWWHGTEKLKETTNSLTIENVGVDDAGRYKCIVTGRCDHDESTAFVSVRENVSKTTGLIDETICEGADKTLRVDFSGTDLQYEWKKDGVKKGSNQNTLQITDIPLGSDGSNYTCRVYSPYGCGDETESMILSVDPKTTINTPPADQVVCEDGKAIFSVDALGKGPFTYKWYEGMNLLSGETNDKLEVTPVRITDDGNTYRAIVKGSGVCESVTSSSAKLKVNKNVRIVSSPSSITVPDGKTAIFSVIAEGAPTLQYQWYEENKPLPGETNSTLNVTASVVGNDGYKYHCVVTSSTGCGIETTAHAVLTVDATAIVQEPESKAVCDGDECVFVCKAEGNVTFQWEKMDGTIMPSIQVKESDGPPQLWRSEMKISSAEVLRDNGTQYKCIVKGLLKPLSSRVVTLTVNKNNSVSDPKDQSVCPDDKAVFEVVGEGDGILSYEWFDSSHKKVGGDRILELKGTPVNAGKTYYCKVSSSTGCGTPQTKAVHLLLDQETSIEAHLSDTPVCEGGKKIFKVEAKGTPPMSYSWTKNGNPTGWGDVNSHTVDPLSLTDAGTYLVTVKGKCGIAQSTIDFQVKEYPKITGSLTDITLCEGNDYDFIVDAEGSDLVYTWYKDGGLDSKVTGRKYSLLNLSKGADAVMYKCEVSNMCDMVTTSSQLTLKTPVSIITDLKDPNVCEGENVELQVVAEGDDKVYQWYRGDKPVGKDQAKFSIYPKDLENGDRYSVKVIGYCNTETSSTEVTVNPNIHIINSFDEDDYCVGEDVELAVFAEGTDLHYSWTKDDLPVFGDQNRIKIPSVKLKDEGHYKCVVSAKCGSPITVEADIKVHPILDIVSGFGGVDICEGGKLILGTKVVGDDLTFEWARDGKILGVNNDTLVLDNVSKDQSGVYVMNVNGHCGHDIASATVLVKENTELNKPLNNIEKKCEGEDVVYEVTALGHNLWFEWFYNGKLLPETTNRLHIEDLVADKSGTYMCKIHGDCDDLKSSSELEVQKVPQLRNGFKDTKICEDEDLLLNIDVVDAKVSYRWKHNKVTLPCKTNELSLEHVDESKEGTYTVTAVGFCGNVVNTAEVDVRSKADFISQTGDLSVCEIEPSVSFEVVVKGDDLAYQWKKEGELLAGETNSVLIISPVEVDDAGSYTCDISTSCGSSMTSVPSSLEVFPRSKITTQPKSKELCENSDYDLVTKASGLDIAYQWRKDKIEIPGATNSVFHIKKAKADDSGVYDCVVTSSCGTELFSYEATIKVERNPNSSILGRMELCESDQKVLYQAPFDLDLQYHWTVENGSIVTGEDTRFFEVDWNKADEGRLHLTVESVTSGCNAQIDSTVNLLPLPDVHLAKFDTIGACAPSFELFGANIEGGIYRVDGIPSKLFKMDRGPGEYMINYTYTDDNGCSASSEYRSLVVDPMPTVRAYKRNLNIGVCQEVFLSAQSTEDSYNWGPSTNLDFANVRAPLFRPGKTQRLKVMVTDRFGCSAHDYVNVNVAPNPDVETINDTIIGECRKIQLTTENKGGELEKINWNFGVDLDFADVLSPNLEHPRVGSNYYTIKVEDPYGCVDKDSVHVTVMASPDLGEDRVVCEGEEVVVKLDPLLKNPTWSDGFEGNLRVLQQVGNYQVSVEDSWGCSDELKIQIRPEPIIHLRDTFLFKGQSVTLDPQLNYRYGPYDYEWQDGSFFPIFTVNTEGKYSLLVKDFAGCSSSKEIYVEEKENFINAPNAFIPDGIGENSRFFLQDVDFVDDFNFYVYNRWGTLVFSSKEIGIRGGWDGTYKGEKCPGAAYVWVATSNGKLLGKGIVVLIR
ncbi:MAG: gliding motility-associated C-terminal domain-containing protein [Marinifilaceae bacterium]